MRTGGSRLLSGDAFLIDQQQRYIKVISVRVSDELHWLMSGVSHRKRCGHYRHCRSLITLFKYTTNVVLLTLGANTNTTGGGKVSRN